MPDELPAIAGGMPIRTTEPFLVFGRPAIGNAEINAVVECLQRRWLGTGPKAGEFEREFARYKGGGVAVATSSGTAAIHLSLAALGIRPGDEVITSDMTFCSTVHAIVHAGATPVLADCDRWTFNLTAETLAAKITPRTKAIVVVHMCGRCCDMDPILALAGQHGLWVVEDCAHAIEAHYKGTPVGLLGHAGCFSFYVTKNVTSVEGGMVLTRLASLERDLRELGHHGMNSGAWTRFCRKGYEHYEVVRTGFKYNLPDLHAVIALAQLGRIEEHARRRQYVWQRYDDAFADLPCHLPPCEEPQSRHARHLYTPLLDLERLRVDREQILAAMTAENIGVGVHFIPVHRHRAYAHLHADGFPNADFVGRRTLSLPLAGDMTDGDVEDTCRAFSRILRFYSKPARGVARSSYGGSSATIDRRRTGGN